MNFMPGSWAGEQPNGSEPTLTLELAHVIRSKIIDKCAEAERHVLRLLRTTDDAISSRAPLSQKLCCLKNQVLGGHVPGRVGRIHELLNRLEPLSNLRSELAHSTLSTAQIEGLQVAVLWNADAPEDAEGTRTILTLTKLREVHMHLSRVANSLKQAADRASGTETRLRKNGG